MPGYEPWLHRLFPPYTGGCIGFLHLNVETIKVSSLYGRVYRCGNLVPHRFLRFLPIREGVSPNQLVFSEDIMFPPYTGGCIGLEWKTQSYWRVSSLYGRVYRYVP